MPYKRPTLRQRTHYLWDRFMSRGTPALVSGLFALSGIIIVIAALYIYLRQAAPDGHSFGKILWDSLMRTLDPGTMGGDEGNNDYLGAMLFVTMGGIFIVSALIGVLSNELNQQLERLRKGRSTVIEKDHTVILGWSPQIFTILSELMIANENQPRPRIVVLAEKDKLTMEDEFHARVEKRGKTKVIFRSGSPIDLTDLEIVNPHRARSIIILPPDHGDEDAYVIKVVLAITNNPNRHEKPYHIVTQLLDEKNLDVIRTISERDKVQPILTSDMIARIMTQTSRQSGLSVIYTQLFQFEGDEIYLENTDKLIGKSYGEALNTYETSSLIGLRQADGTVLMNPPMETQIASGDQVFAISEDDDTVATSGLGAFPIKETQIQINTEPSDPPAEKALILGWNRSAPIILCELNNYVAKGSKVLVVASQDIRAEFKNCAATANHLDVEFRIGDPTSRQLLDELKTEDYEHIIVLSCGDLTVQDADANTLVTLLHLRDIAENSASPYSIVSEMLELRNRQLAEVAQVNDFIVSDHLISLMMAQLSENEHLYDVFTDIFNADGSEIYLKPVSDYVTTNEPVNFYTLVEAARRCNQTAVGYRLAADSNDARLNYGVHINPHKAEAIRFREGDKLIVLSEV
jgi:voltage-gated potassium channel Kch